MPAVLEEQLSIDVRDVVVSTITEIVDEHLMQMRCRKIYDVIVSELITEVVNSQFVSICDEVDVEISTDSLLSEAVDDVLNDTIQTILNEMKSEYEEALKYREKNAVEAKLKEVLAPRLMLTYLMN